MTDLTALAEGLTEAQRNVLYWLTDEWVDDRSWDGLVAVLWHDDALLLQPAIVQYRKTNLSGWRPVHHHRLTELGLALRSHLLKGNGDADA